MQGSCLKLQVLAVYGSVRARAGLALAYRQHSLIIAGMQHRLNLWDSVS